MVPAGSCRQIPRDAPARRSRICDRSLIALNFFGRRINGGVGANFFPLRDYAPPS